MTAPLRGASRANNAITGPLLYRGGGVATTPLKVVLVFWGSEWGDRTHDANGYDNFSNDTSNMVPYLEAMYAGIGHGGERWSAVATQYCSNTTVNATSCPADNASHIAYPIHGVFTPENVWYDNANSYGADTKTPNNIAQEAKNAHDHFGDPANTQYIVLSPPGKHPDGFNAGASFCSWHSFTHSVNIAFTNMPYLTDKSNCGANALGGPLDGVSIVAGHEYQETITDPDGATGWTDDSSSSWENGDKCAWVHSGPGAIATVTFPTGTFPQQTEWSNAIDGCAMTQVDLQGGDGASLTQPSDQTASVGHSFHLQLSGSVSDGGALSFDAGDLQNGLSVDSSTGVISGIPTASGTRIISIQARSSTGASATKFFSLAISSSPVRLSEPGTLRTPIGSAFTFTPTAVADAGTLSFGAVGLPSWASIDPSTGRIFGTSDALGTASVILTATANGISDSVTFDLVVGGNVTITPIPSKSFITGKAISLQVTATDSGGASLTFEASGLPSTVTIDEASGLISGSAVAVGTGAASITVHGGGEDKTSTFQWSVVTSTITVTSKTSLQMVPGQVVSVHLTAISTSGLATYFSRATPCYLTLDADGTLWGTMQNVSYAFTCSNTVTVSDGYASKNVMLTISIGPVALSSTDSTSLYAGKSSRIRMVGVSSTRAKLTYSTSTLPAGLSINPKSGSITGTPTTSRTTNVTVTAKDPSGNKTTLKIKIVVTKPTISFQLPASPQVVRNADSTVAITATDSAGERLTFSATGLPAGLSINTATGTISGKPTAQARSYTVNITVTDPGGATGTVSFTLRVVST